MEQCERQGHAGPSSLESRHLNYADMLLRRDAPVGDRRRPADSWRRPSREARAIGYVWAGARGSLALQMELQGVAGADVHTSIDAVHRAVASEHPDLSAAAADDGSITIMFSDIAGSTARAEALGDERWLELIRSHNAIVREQVQAHGGREVANRGDGFMVAFASPRTAVDCAIAIQARLRGAYVRARPRGPSRCTLACTRATQRRAPATSTAPTSTSPRGSPTTWRRRARSWSRSACGTALRRSRSLRFDEGREVELKGLSGKHRVFEVRWQE